MRNIKDIPLENLPVIVKKLGLKQYNANQIIKWLYQKGATSFDEMTDLSKDARALLAKNFTVSRLKLEKTLTSTDGTKKFAWKLKDGNIIESVLIPSEPYSKVPNPPQPPLF